MGRPGDARKAEVGRRCLARVGGRVKAHGPAPWSREEARGCPIGAMAREVWGGASRREVSHRSRRPGSLGRSEQARRCPIAAAAREVWGGTRRREMSRRSRGPRSLGRSEQARGVPSQPRPGESGAERGGARCPIAAAALGVASGVRRPSMPHAERLPLTRCAAPLAGPDGSGLNRCLRRSVYRLTGRFLDAEPAPGDHSGRGPVSQLIGTRRTS